MRIIRMPVPSLIVTQYLNAVYRFILIADLYTAVILYTYNHHIAKICCNREIAIVAVP